MQCPHCGSTKCVKNGSYKGSQRFICKDCCRAFGDKVHKFTYADKKRCLELYLNNTGIRKCAKLIGCSSFLVIRWIREFAINLQQQLQNAHDNLQSDKIPEIIEMNEIHAQMKKDEQELRYGLLILGKEVKLLRM
jgi:transposase-like protein